MRRLLRASPFTVYALVLEALWWWARANPPRPPSAAQQVVGAIAQLLAAPLVMLWYVVAMVLRPVLQPFLPPRRFVAGISPPAAAALAILAFALLADALLRWWRGPALRDGARLKLRTTPGPPPADPVP